MAKVRIALLPVLLCLLLGCSESSSGASEYAPPPEDAPALAGDISSRVGPHISAPTLDEALLRALQAEPGRAYDLSRQGGRLVGESPRLAAQIVVDGSGALLAPDDGPPPLRMGLAAWGCAGQERAVDEAGPELADDGRAHLRRAGLGEWFVNGPVGLEQGFDVEAAPGPCASLRFVSRPSDGLRSQIRDRGAAVHFVDAEGAARYRVDHAFAVDAAGRRLPIRFEPEGDAYALRVDIDGATFPIAVDPLAYVLEGDLVPPGAGIRYYGLDVSLHADTAVVGAYLSSAAGPVGSGAALVFVRVGGMWAHQATLTAPDAAMGDWFGWEVDLWGDTVAVGVMKDDTPRGADAGSVRMFTRAGGVWSQESVIEPTTPGAEDHFGCGVALHRDSLVAGPYGGPDLRRAGSAYVFTRSAGSWSQQARLRPTASGGDQPGFGRKVAIWEDTIVVGALLEDGPAGVDEGAAYVFTRTGGAWSSGLKLRSGSPRANGWFGYEVDAGSLAVAVAAPGSWSGTGPASVSIFEDPGTGWAEVATFPYVATGDLDAVSSYGSRVAADEVVYERGATGWTELARLDRGRSREVRAVELYEDAVLVGTSGSRYEGAQVYRLSAPLADGVSCVGDFECASGFCVEGVCCETECSDAADGSCRGCTSARTGQADGLCRPLTTAIAASTTCRHASGVCDEAEACSPASLDCPPDVFTAAGTECRAGSACDPAETCTGAGPDCPADTRAAPGYVCRPAAGACDVPETCDGWNRSCPRDRVVARSTSCRPAVGDCDVAEACDGVNPTCPPDTTAPTGTVCRVSAGACDVEEYCVSGLGDCPPDTFAPSGTECRPALLECDLPELCDGHAVSCPPDAVAPAGTSCRPAGGVCDVEERCDGSTHRCPRDAWRPDGANCDDALVCNGVDTCMSGVCRAGTSPDCDDADPCTTDRCSDAGGGCEHAPIAGCCVSDADCDDGDACTLDACPVVGEGCEHARDPACDDGGVARDAGIALRDAGTDAGELDGGLSDAGAATRDAGAWMDGGPPGEETAGCGCSAPGRGGSPWAFALLGLAMAWWRRRRG